MATADLVTDLLSFDGTLGRKNSGVITLQHYDWCTSHGMLISASVPRVVKMIKQEVPGVAEFSKYCQWFRNAFLSRHLFRHALKRHLRIVKKIQRAFRWYKKVRENQIQEHITEWIVYESKKRKHLKTEIAAAAALSRQNPKNATTTAEKDRLYKEYMSLDIPMSKKRYIVTSIRVDCIKQFIMSYRECKATLSKQRDTTKEKLLGSVSIPTFKFKFTGKELSQMSSKFGKVEVQQLSAITLKKLTLRALARMVLSLLSLIKIQRLPKEQRPKFLVTPQIRIVAMLVCMITETDVDERRKQIPECISPLLTPTEAPLFPIDPTPLAIYGEEQQEIANRKDETARMLDDVGSYVGTQSKTVRNMLVHLAVSQNSKAIANTRHTDLTKELSSTNDAAAGIRRHLALREAESNLIQKKRPAIPNKIRVPKTMREEVVSLKPDVSLCSAPAAALKARRRYTLRLVSTVDYVVCIAALVCRMAIISMKFPLIRISITRQYIANTVAEARRKAQLMREAEAMQEDQNKAESQKQPTSLIYQNKTIIKERSKLKDKRRATIFTDLRTNVPEKKQKFIRFSKVSTLIDSCNFKRGARQSRTLSRALEELESFEVTETSEEDAEKAQNDFDSFFSSVNCLPLVFYPLKPPIKQLCANQIANHFFASNKPPFFWHYWHNINLQSDLVYQNSIQSLTPTQAAALGIPSGVALASFLHKQGSRQQDLNFITPLPPKDDFKKKRPCRVALGCQNQNWTRTEKGNWVEKRLDCVFPYCDVSPLLSPSPPFL